MKKYIKANHDFDYDIGGNDPADWYNAHSGLTRLERKIARMKK